MRFRALSSSISVWLVIRPEPTGTHSDNAVLRSVAKNRTKWERYYALPR